MYIIIHFDNVTWQLMIQENTRSFKTYHVKMHDSTRQ